MALITTARDPFGAFRPHCPVVGQITSVRHGIDGAVIGAQEPMIAFISVQRAEASRWGVKANVVECHPHRFRHACATNLLESGADIRMVQTVVDPEV